MPRRVSLTLVCTLKKVEGSTGQDAVPVCLPPLKSPIRVVFKARLASLAAVASPSQRPSHCPRQPPASVSGALNGPGTPSSFGPSPINAMQSDPIPPRASRPKARPTADFSRDLLSLAPQSLLQGETARLFLGAWPGLVMMISRASLDHSSQPRSA